MSLMRPSAQPVTITARPSLYQPRSHSSSSRNATTLSLTTLIIQTIIEPSDIYDPSITKPFAVVCLFVGSVGNSLSFIVFTQKQLRRYSTFRYLAYLAIIDLIVLYLGLGNIILRDYFLFDIRVQYISNICFNTIIVMDIDHCIN